MALSKRYKSLTAAISKVRAALLPSRFEPTGSYRSADRVHLRSVSFRLLVHAELEAYLEDRAFELFNEGWTRWDSHRATSAVIAGLLSYAGFETKPPPTKLGLGKERYDDMASPIQKAQSVWRHTHKNNHGIKEENVLALLLPLGVDAQNIDSTLLADLSSFGGRRGEVAHKSSLGPARYADPKDELETARLLVSDLKELDALISASIENVRRQADALGA